MRSILKHDVLEGTNKKEESMIVRDLMSTNVGAVNQYTSLNSLIVLE
jgi:NRPS condensation-like uncharacterized protein